MNHRRSRREAKKARDRSGHRSSNARAKKTRSPPHSTCAGVIQCCWTRLDVDLQLTRGLHIIPPAEEK